MSRETGKGGIGEYLRKRVEAAGGLCEKHESPGRRKVPDYLVTWPWARMHLVETKWPDGEPDEGQLRDHARRAQLGVVVIVLDTEDKIETYIHANTADPRLTVERQYDLALWYLSSVNA